MTPELIREAWKILRDISVRRLASTYALLGVEMPIAAYRGESFYGGMGQPDGVGLGCDTLRETVNDLMVTVAKAKPMCKTASVVWTKGDGVPSYWYSEPVGHYKDVPSYVERGRTREGKLVSDGMHGLGIAYDVACRMWGKNIVDALPTCNHKMENTQ